MIEGNPLDQNIPATSAAIAQYARVAYDSNGQISEADGSEAWIGVANRAVPVSTATGLQHDRGTSVTGVNTPGAINFIASAAISIGDRLNPAANGKVVTNVAGVWVALTAAAADGDIIAAVKAAT